MVPALCYVPFAAAIPSLTGGICKEYKVPLKLAHGALFT